MIYYIFAGATYYPSGGLDDFRLTCTNIYQIDDYVKKDKDGDFVIYDRTYDWVQIIKTEDGNLENGKDITSSYELR